MTPEAALQRQIGCYRKMTGQQRFDGSGISYMLTRSMASNFRGIPRTTHNLDFVLVTGLAERRLVCPKSKATLVAQPLCIPTATTTNPLPQPARSNC